MGGKAVKIRVIRVSGKAFKCRVTWAGCQSSCVQDGWEVEKICAKLLLGLY